MLRCGLKNAICLVEFSVELQNGGDVSAPVAVVRCRPDRDELIIKKRFVSFHDELVCSGDQGQIVLMVKFFDDVSAEDVAGAPERESPSLDVLGIRPEQVTHGSFVRNFAFPVDGSQLVERGHAGTESAVDAKYAIVDDGGEGQVVEEFGAAFPDLRRSVLSQAFVVESVDLSDLPRLVVASDQRHAIRVPHLQRHQKQKRFDGIVPAVHEVSQKNIPRLRTIAADSEELEQVVKLPVQVAAYRDWSLYSLDVRFGHKDFFCQFAELDHAPLFQRLATTQLLDPRLDAPRRADHENIALRETQ